MCSAGMHNAASSGPVSLFHMPCTHAAIGWLRSYGSGWCHFFYLYFMVVPLPSCSSGSDSECYRELSVADEAEAEAVHRPGGQCPDSEWPQEDHGRGPAGKGKGGVVANWQ